MERKQYEICIEVLKRFHDNDILPCIVLIGSWCLPFYKTYFNEADYEMAFRTRDIDFLIPTPSQIRKNVDIAALLNDMGFIVKRSYPSGFIKLQHPELIIEFLVPEKGKGSDKPLTLPMLGINAQPLRFLNLLSDSTVSIKVEGIPISLPNPVNFALHKLIISGRRQNAEKTEKDRTSAAQLLNFLIRNGYKEKIRNLFNSLPNKWQKMILNSLKGETEAEIKDLLRKMKLKKTCR